MISGMPKLTRPNGEVPISLSVRVPIELYQQLQLIADQHGVALSDVARIAMREGTTSADRLIAEAIEQAESAGAVPLR
jgi:hypothetical protein